MGGKVCLGNIFFFPFFFKPPGFLKSKNKICYSNNTFPVTFCLAYKFVTVKPYTVYSTP